MAVAIRVHQRSIHCYALVTTLVAVLFTSSQSQDVVCSGSVNKNSPPRFLCGLEVDIRRMDNCSVIIIERITFPHTVDAMYERKLRKVPNVQRVSSVLVKQNDESVDFDVSLEDGNDFFPLSFKTKKSTRNSTYDIQYMLSNGAFQFSKKCDGTDGKSFPNNNVIVWRSGEIEEGVDRLNVRMESEGRLNFVGLDDQFDSQKENGVLRATTTNVTGEVEFYARERGTPLCERKLVCKESRGLRPWIIFLIVAGAILALVAAIVAAWFAKRKFGRGGALQ